jgi:hypothetical protein
MAQPEWAASLLRRLAALRELSAVLEVRLLLLADVRAA